MLAKLLSLSRTVAVGLFVGLGIGGLAVAQLGPFINPVVIGHLIFGGSGGAQIPVGAGCTIAQGATDAAGQCVASATSGTITFGVPFVRAPFCLVVDASATSTVSMPVYTVSNTAITLGTIISTHLLIWSCSGQPGG